MHGHLQGQEAGEGTHILHVTSGLLLPQEGLWAQLTGRQVDSQKKQLCTGPLWTSDCLTDTPLPLTDLTAWVSLPTPGVMDVQ